MSADYTIFVVVLGGLIISTSAIIIKARQKKFDNNPENVKNDEKAKENFASLCTPDETIKTACRGGHIGEYYALTTKRILINNKKGLKSIPLDSIKKIKFEKFGGGRAAEPEECFQITLYADKKYSLYRSTEKFVLISDFLFNRD